MRKYAWLLLPAWTLVGQVPPSMQSHEWFMSCVRNTRAMSPKTDAEAYCRWLRDRGSKWNLDLANPIQEQLKRQFDGAKKQLPGGPARVPAAGAAQRAEQRIARPSGPVVERAKEEPAGAPVDPAKAAEIKEGWTREELLERLGAPAARSGMQAEEHREKYVYRTTDGKMVTVRLVNGVVTEVSGG